MVKKLLKSVDFGIIILVILLFAIGVVGLYSAISGANGIEARVPKQIAWFVIGFVSIIAFIFIDYRYLKKLLPIIYVITVIMLVAVLFTKPINGARSWFNFGTISLQPSEFAKVSVILTIAFLIEYFKSKKTLNKFYNILLILLVLAIPTFLIIKQPDYGTAIVLMFITFAMLFVGGIKWQYIVSALIIVSVLLPIGYKFILPEHAKSRIDVFLNPELDPKGAGYNIIQSKLAVGSGQLYGMGYLNGTQTQKGMLPMKATDFIFPVISEEFGFIMSSFIVILFVILLIRIINVSQGANDDFGKLICVGVFALLFAHFTENIGMTIGLLPITGIPLPFMSYGGSSLFTNMICIGLVISISCRRKHNLFSK